MTLCGIPKVKLSGKLEDWKHIKEKVATLDVYGLQFWT